MLSIHVDAMLMLVADSSSKTIDGNKKGTLHDKLSTMFFFLPIWKAIWFALGTQVCNELKRVPFQTTVAQCTTHITHISQQILASNSSHFTNLIHGPSWHTPWRLPQVQLWRHN